VVTDWWTARTVAITGATGYVGTALRNRLAARGARLRLATRQARPTEHASVCWQQGDIRDPDLWRAIVAGADVIFHLAAQTSVAEWNAVKALTTGTQVRITVGSRTVRGGIDRTMDGALVVTTEKGQEMFDRQEVSVVSVKKPSHRKRNTLIGLAAGTGAGLGIGIATRPKPGQLEIITPDAITAGFTAAGAIGGTLVGLIIPPGGWREVYKK